MRAARLPAVAVGLSALLAALVLAPIPAASGGLQRVDFLVGQSFVAVGEEDDAAVGEADFPIPPPPGKFPPAFPYIAYRGIKLFLSE